MKIEDSGMPEESYWNSLFDIGGIIDWLNIPEASKIVEIGCGYGTFTVPMAQLSPKNQLLAFDIEAQMLECTQANIEKARCNNVQFLLRDIMTNGTGLESNSVDFVLLFNILHCKDKQIFLREASRVLKPGGIIAIIHWRKDIPTPRGPDVELRPDVVQIRNASQKLDFKEIDEMNLAPYHWGMKLIKSF
jgi:ubiquinone/menaquinone biosynthesis C-methylase UbiE